MTPKPEEKVYPTQPVEDLQAHKHRHVLLQQKKTHEPQNAVLLGVDDDGKTATAIAYRQVARAVITEGEPVRVVHELHTRIARAPQDHVRLPA